MLLRVFQVVNVMSTDRPIPPCDARVPRVTSVLRPAGTHTSYRHAHFHTDVGGLGLVSDLKSNVNVSFTSRATIIFHIVVVDTQLRA